MGGAVVKAQSRWKGRSQEERRAERRTALVQSAIGLYGSKGFHNTGVRAICQDAGLTERYFYESFANGEELLLAAFEEVVSLMHARIVAAVEPCAAPEDGVMAMLHAYYSGLFANPSAAKVFLVEIVGINDAIDRAIERSRLRLTEPLLELCDPGRTGPLATDPLLRQGVAGGLLHIALAWGADGYRQPVADVVRSAARLCRLVTR